MAAFDKRAFIYIRKSDEYGTNHPDWSVMRMNGFSVIVVRPPTFDPLAEATVKSAKEAGLYPAIWDGPKDLGNGVREDPMVYANRISGVVGDCDKVGRYLYGIVTD